jgi:hypothetical protein
MNTKPVKNFEGLYTVSDDGRVFSVERQVNVNGHAKQKAKTIKAKELGIRIDIRGYSFVTLCKDGVSKKYRVHRILMESFCPVNNSNSLDVNHKNGIKTDNRVANLEWLTRSQNLVHRYKVLNQAHSMTGRFGKDHHRSMAVIALDMEGKEKMRFESMMDAQRAGYQASKISSCISGNRKTHGGFQWQAPNLSGFV